MPNGTDHLDAVRRLHARDLPQRVGVGEGLGGANEHVEYAGVRVDLGVGAEGGIRPLHVQCPAGFITGGGVLSTCTDTLALPLNWAQCDAISARVGTMIMTPQPCSMAPPTKSVSFPHPGARFMSTFDVRHVMADSATS